MRYSRVLPLLILLAAALLVPARPAAAGVPAGRVAYEHATAGPAQQTTPGGIRTCHDLETADRRLERTEGDLSPEGRRGRPELCLLYYPQLDVYKAAILRVDSVEHFRVAKTDALRRLVEASVDLCRIATWEGWGSPAPRLQYDDRLDLPVECAPRVVPGDAGADEWLPHVRAAAARLVDLTAEQMGWRPNRALTILVVTDPEGASIGQYAGETPGTPAGYAAEQLRAGRSGQGVHSSLGSLILLNLSRGRQLQPRADAMRAAVDAQLSHEYTHFAQYGLSSVAAVPHWFLEGQAVYQEERNGGRLPDYLGLAARTQREGAALPLAELTRSRDWFARERAAGRMAVYSRAYAAVVFLVERHGFAATVQLLRDNHHGSYERFNELLAGLTGMDLDALDRAVGGWLVNRGTAPPEDVASPGPALPPFGSSYTAR